MYTITPLWLGSMVDYDRSGHLYNTDCGVRMTCPFIAWLVRGNDKIILVDTGPPDPDSVRRNHAELSVEIREKDHILRALEREGVSPEEISFIINTHLHWDHCGGNPCFPGIPFYVQRSEILYALDPLPQSRFTYESPAVQLTPPWTENINCLRLLDGDTGLAEGISVLHTPGHSPGGQCVLVETSAGLHIICGDTVNLYDNWTGMGRPYRIAPGIHVNLPDCYASYDRIAALSPVCILPGHDPLVFRSRQYPSGPQSANVEI